MPVILECENLSKRYGSVPAVANFSLSARAGQFITLLGPSGCGKTTTLRLLAGFEAPETGSINLKGRLVAGDGVMVPPEARRIGMVFQEYALFPHLNTLDNIAFGLQGARIEKYRRAEAMLALVGLAGTGQRMPYELSGGQQQRVALARALAPAPDVLLLDEPFSNLDAALRASVRAEIRAILRETGVTCIFVTHDQEEALSLSDRVIVMFNGRVAQNATPQDLYHHPQTAEVAAFVGEANFVQAVAGGSAAESPLGLVVLQQAIVGNVRLLVRPEQVLLAAPRADGCTARVLWREFYGHDQRLGLRLESGEALIARCDSRLVYLPGDEVDITINGPLLAYPAG